MLNDGIDSENIQMQWTLYICMSESFQDYFWIQDFEADFP